jgi:hypothetical protein
MENIAGDIRKNRPNVVLGFLGSWRESREELIDRLPDVDLVIGARSFIAPPITWTRFIGQTR